MKQAGPGRVRPSIEYRSFWWHGQCVAWGPYWYQLAAYARAASTAVLPSPGAQLNASMPFLVIDFAGTAAGGWIVIECNEAQESGYAGAAPVALWQEVLALAGA